MISWTIYTLRKAWTKRYGRYAWAWTLLALLSLRCSGAICSFDVREEVAPLTDCSPEELDIDGCGSRFWAQCRDDRYYCHLTYQDNGEGSVTCNRVPW